MSFEYLHVDIDPSTRLGIVRLDRQLHMLSADVLRELRIFLQLIRGGRPPEVRALVLADPGRRSDPPDVSVGEFGPADRAAFDREGRQALETLEAMSTPVVACISGQAVDDGLHLTMASDRVFASDGARFGYPLVQLGLDPALGASPLPQRIDRRVARELLASGRTLCAQEAEEIGLIHRRFESRSAMFLEARRALDRLGRSSPPTAGLGEDSAGRTSESRPRDPCA